jgi:hypothetical protein
MGDQFTVLDIVLKQGQRVYADACELRGYVRKNGVGDALTQRTQDLSLPGIHGEVAVELGRI